MQNNGTPEQKTVSKHVAEIEIDSTCAYKHQDNTKSKTLAPGTRTEVLENEMAQEKKSKRENCWWRLRKPRPKQLNRSCAQIETGYEPKTSSGNRAGQKFRVTLSSVAQHWTTLPKGFSGAAQ
jgi:hypothetical protein